MIYSNHRYLTGTVYVTKYATQIDYDNIKEYSDVFPLSQFYDYYRGVMYEVKGSECTKYHYDFPYSMFSIPKHLYGNNQDILETVILENNIKKRIKWYINENGFISKIIKSTERNIELIIELNNFEIFRSPLAPPTIYFQDTSTIQHYCTELKENNFSPYESCPSECSNHGICIFSKCYCYNGFEGKDCADLGIDVYGGFCGNGIVEECEECDDGNNNNMDCCNNNCEVVNVGLTCLSNNPCKLPFGICSTIGTCEAENDDHGICSDNDECTDDICINGNCISTYNEYACPFKFHNKRIDFRCLDVCIDKCDEKKACSHLNTECIKYSCKYGKCVPHILHRVECDDQNECTYDDKCVRGECVGKPLDCSSLDDECSKGVCNKYTGQCEEKYLNGTICRHFSMCVDGICLEPIA